MFADGAIGGKPGLRPNALHVADELRDAALDEAMLLLGGTLLVVRLRQEDRWFAARKLFGVAWALTCLCVGTTLLLMAAGVVDQPAQPGRNGGRPKERRAIEFPTDR